MKIEIEIPDKYSVNHLRLFAGIQEVAHKLSPEDSWKVKTDSCSRCGECCDGCESLEKGVDGFSCGRLGKIPFECAKSDGYRKGCTIKWREV